MKNFYEKQLVSRFEKQEIFPREDLFKFYAEYEPELNEGTFGWRIYDLKKKNIIRNVGKGIYSLSGKALYIPTLGKLSKKIAKLFSKNYSDLEYCLWETLCLNEFSNHQATTSFTVLEVEKELLDSVFYFLKKNKMNDLYLQPDEKMIERYVLEKENPVVLKSLITRAPLQKIKDKRLKITVPHLEKILVDLFCDSKTFYFYAGKELENIYTNALDFYTIDFSRLLNYAKRRGKESEIKDFIENNLNYPLENILR